MSSSRGTTTLVLLATLLIAGSAAAGIASFFFATSGSSVGNMQAAPPVASAAQSNLNAATALSGGCQQVAPAAGSDPEVPNFVCSYVQNANGASRSVASVGSITGGQANSIQTTTGGQANSIQSISCVQIGVDSGDGEYGPLAILSCTVTYSTGDYTS